MLDTFDLLLIVKQSQHRKIINTNDAAFMLLSKKRAKVLFFYDIPKYFCFFCKKGYKKCVYSQRGDAPTAIFEFQMDRNQSYFRLRRNLPNKTLVLLLRED